MKCKKLIAILLIFIVILCIGFIIWKSNHDLFLDHMKNWSIPVILVATDI